MLLLLTGLESLKGLLGSQSGLQHNQLTWYSYILWLIKCKRYWKQFFISFHSYLSVIEILSKLLFPGVRSGWSCRACRVCQVCRGEAGAGLGLSLVLGDPRVVSCEHCDKLYHATCLRPMMATVPKYGWKCKVRSFSLILTRTSWQSIEVTRCDMYNINVACHSRIA